MYIWIHDKYSSSSCKQRLWQTENCFDIAKLIFSCHMCHCGVVVKQLLARADKPGSTPGDAVFVSLYRLYTFFCLVFIFNTVFLYSHCWPCWSCTWVNIYFRLKSGVLVWRRDFKSSWSAYWPSLRPEKTIRCQDMTLLWNSWIFFNQ